MPVVPRMQERVGAHCKDADPFAISVQADHLFAHRNQLGKAPERERFPWSGFAPRLPFPCVSLARDACYSPAIGCSDDCCVAAATIQRGSQVRLSHLSQRPGSHASHITTLCRLLYAGLRLLQTPVSRRFAYKQNADTVLARFREIGSGD